DWSSDVCSSDLLGDSPGSVGSFELDQGYGMKKNDRHPGISYHKMPVGGDIMGLLFVVACMIILLGRIPVFWYFFGLAVLFGAGIAVVLHFINSASSRKP